MVFLINICSFPVDFPSTKLKIVHCYEKWVLIIQQIQQRGPQKVGIRTAKKGAPGPGLSGNVPSRPCRSLATPTATPGGELKSLALRTAPHIPYFNGV